MTIAISATFGGPELAGCRFDKMLSKAMQAHEARPDAVPAKIVAVFKVAGSIVTDFEFTGFRTGAFSKAKQRLVIQIAVPSEMVNAPEKTIASFIASSLHEAVALAKPKFQKAKLDYPEEKLLGVVAAIAKALGA